MGVPEGTIVACAAAVADGEVEETRWRGVVVQDCPACVFDVIEAAREVCEMLVSPCIHEIGVRG